MYKYLFGPVPSRRLGISLGVDLVPRKVCSLDCIYCEVGKTTKLTTERREYIPYGKIKKELLHYFKNSPDPDYITFSGSGEPTLNSRLGDIILFIKEIRPDIPVAVLTNGTTLTDKTVREELLNADIVLPSLDAATQKVFDLINRPEKTLNIKQYVEGLVQFRQAYQGKIWLEVFILPGINNSDDELAKLKRHIERIGPDSIQLNTLDRPGTVENLVPADTFELSRIKKLLGNKNVEIIASTEIRKEVKSYRDDAATAILETIARRPCTLDDLKEILGLHISEINKYLDVLESEKKIIAVRQERGIFYKPA
ncbi:MAG: radical SAM protein [Bacteroidales bacterium]|nr:radical SAM protein [Bacteroidales bacterium]